MRTFVYYLFVGLIVFIDTDLASWAKSVFSIAVSVKILRCSRFDLLTLATFFSHKHKVPFPKLTRQLQSGQLNNGFKASPRKGTLHHNKGIGLWGNCALKQKRRLLELSALVIILPHFLYFVNPEFAHVAAPPRRIAIPGSATHCRCCALICSTERCHCYASPSFAFAAPGNASRRGASPRQCRAGQRLAVPLLCNASPCRC